MLGANDRYFEDTDRVDGKRKAENKSTTFEKELKEKRDMD
jgi:hypothetical protein